MSDSLGGTQNRRASPERHQELPVHPVPIGRGLASQPTRQLSSQERKLDLHIYSIAVSVASYLIYRRLKFLASSCHAALLTPPPQLRRLRKLRGKWNAQNSSSQ